MGSGISSSLGLVEGNRLPAIEFSPRRGNLLAEDLAHGSMMSHR